MIAKRIEWVDTAKGICILLVVLHHISQYYDGFQYPFSKDFMTFRMPLYFILSGLFFKKYSGILFFLRKKINKLIIPYTFWFLIFGVFLPFVLWEYFEIKMWFYSSYGLLAIKYIFSEHILANPSIWFLVCLFNVNIIFYLICMTCRNCKNVIITSIAIGYVGVIMGYFKLDLPYYIDSALSAIPFFCFGWILRNQTNFLYRKDKKKLEILYIILIIIYGFILHFCNKGVCGFISNVFGGPVSWILLYPYGIIGTVSVLYISKIIGYVPVLSYLGRYSIIILCTHVCLIQIADYVACHFIVDKCNIVIGNFILTIILGLVMIPVCRYMLPYFTAQKELI